MLTETAVSTILTASITGAGLIIAIYALITPLSRKIFEERINLHRKKKKQFDKLKEKINEESSDKDFKRLKTLSVEIKETKMFPRYLNYGVSFVFVFYMLSAFLAFLGIINISYRDGVNEILMLWVFSLSTIAFLIVGLSTIFDVYQAMREEFEQLKKEKEEVEKVTRKIERIKEELKRLSDKK